MQNPAKFFFFPLYLFSFLLVLHAMHNDCYLFSMSMLIFIEDNKRNEYEGGGGGSFLENLKFLKFLHSFISYSMHNLIFLNVWTTTWIFQNHIKY